VNREQTEVQVSVTELEETKAYLEGVRSYAGSDLYVEQEARRRLGYVRDGEVPFVVKSPPLEENEDTQGTWWERLFPR
jgi:cell division protein FtsB